MDLSWLPSIVSVGALGVVWWGFRSDNQKCQTEQHELRKRQEQLEMKLIAYREDAHDKFLEEDTHGLICQVKTLEIKTLFTEEMSKFKDDFFSELRGLKQEIKTG